MMKKNKGKGEFVDKEKTLKQIDNPKFMAMRRMQRQFPKPSTQEAELDLLCCAWSHSGEVSFQLLAAW